MSNGSLEVKIAHRLNQLKKVDSGNSEKVIRRTDVSFNDCTPNHLNDNIFDYL